MHSACCHESQPPSHLSVGCAICEREINSPEEPLFLPFNNEERQVCSSCHAEWTKWQNWLQDWDDSFIDLPNSSTVGIPENEVEACLFAGQRKAADTYEAEETGKWNLSMLFQKVRRCLAL